MVSIGGGNRLWVVLDVACTYVLCTHACTHVRMYLRAALRVGRCLVMLDSGCVLKVGHQVSRLIRT